MRLIQWHLSYYWPLEFNAHSLSPMNKLLESWINHFPPLVPYQTVIVATIKTSLVLLLAIISYQITKRVIVGLIKKLILKSRSNLDDILLKRKVFERLSLLVPIIVVFKLIPISLASYPTLVAILTSGILIYAVFVATLAIDSTISALLEIYHTFPISKRMPVQSFAQVARLLLYFVAIILVVSLIVGESPLKLFAGLGAMTAVLMLVFKDSILGFVAGLQLSYNRMVNLGDWVDIPQHKASGDILEIGLTTVKVQNFDNTITTVPTQALINESFKNWRGMQESEGRRIKRSIYIDVNSIGFCNQERLERYSKINFIKGYIDSKQKELDAYNEKQNVNESLVNGRRITNIGTFRAYVLAYLKNHPKINQQLTLLVRQLATSDSGVPIEIYAFSSDKNWVNYESIQADIFDHLFAVAKEFDLKLFQKPTGGDFATLNRE